MALSKPIMGWNSWNTFTKNINEELILNSAKSLLNSGLKDAGYNYITIDDCWALKERDINGRLVPDPEKFPHGMKYVADKIHEMGLKFGMYSCAGYLTCAGYPASYGHEWIDAQTFAEWEIDLLKYDYCFHPTNIRPDLLYKRMALALKSTKRDIIFSACSWGADNTRQWIKETGADIWRSTLDIQDCWNSIKDIGQSQIKFLEYNGKGCFNDMDMLVVGMNGNGTIENNEGCTVNEYQLHFSLWALLNSPLIIGCDINNMSEETQYILKNREVIEINQDSAARQPFLANNFVMEANTERKQNEPYYKDYCLDTPIIAKYLDNGDIALGFFNFTDTPIGCWTTNTSLELLGFSPEFDKEIEFSDLWDNGKLKIKSGDLKFDNGLIYIDKLPAHTCRLFRLKIK